MIVVASFNRGNGLESHIIDTSKLTKKMQEYFISALKNDDEEDEAYKNRIVVDEYDFKFWDAIKKGYVDGVFPLTIDGAVTIAEYNSPSSW